MHGDHIILANTVLPIAAKKEPELIIIMLIGIWNNFQKSHIYMAIVGVKRVQFSTKQKLMKNKSSMTYHNEGNSSTKDPSTEHIAPMMSIVRYSR